MKKVQKVLNLVVEDSNYARGANANAEASTNATTEATAEPTVTAEPTAKAEGLKKASASRYIGNKANGDKKALAEITGYAKFMGVKKVPKKDSNGKAIVRNGKAVITCVWTLATPDEETMTVFSSWGFYETNVLPLKSIVKFSYEVVEEGDSFERDGVETIAESDFLSLRNISVGDMNPYFRAYRKYYRSEISDPDELQDELDMLREEQQMLRKLELSRDAE